VLIFDLFLYAYNLKYILNLLEKRYKYRHTLILAMDYLDHGKVIRQRILLYSGYVLIAVAIVIAALVFVYQAYGFNLGKNNTVIQNGLIFLSSQPNPANIYLNNTLRPEQTNTRLIIPSGVYKVRLTRSGYRDWTRTIEVNGGTVEHFDYPFLIPTKLNSTKLASYTSAPGLVTQSLDKRWLLIEKPGSITDFDLYDFKNPAKPVVSSVSLPSSILSKASVSEGWQFVSWADDNQHILLEHIFDGKYEYILVDRTDLTQSVNLTTQLGTGDGQLTLNNNKYDSYNVLDPATGDLKLYSLSSNTPQLIASHVLAYKTYGSSTVLYVTSEGATKDHVIVKLINNGTTYTIKTLPISTTYLLDLTTYNGTLYAAIGSDTYSRVYIYADPIGQLANYPDQAPLPLWELYVSGVNYLSFSDNAQFIMAEGGNGFAVYDIQNNLGYLYNTSSNPIDPLEPHANWMDGDRLDYVSGSKLLIMDYDHQNIQTLVPEMPSNLPIFSANYKYLMTLNPNSSGLFDLNQTPLVTPSDL
jgi:hypothetical protein